MSASIVALIATWNGEDLLGGCVASVAPHVDRVVVLDGRYADLVGEPIRSDPADLSRIRMTRPGVRVYETGHPWHDEIAKRNVLLELGRAALADVAPALRYALVIDEDELLVNGENLRAWIARAPSRFVPGLPRREPDRKVWNAPSRLFRLTDTVRYSQRSYWLDYTVDDERNLVTLEHAPWGGLFDSADVYVQHRWDERSEWRAGVQREWGRRLAELDHGD